MTENATNRSRPSRETKPIGLLGYETANLGDDTQALATSLCLPGFDRFVDRDQLQRPGFTEPHFLIAQSWFTNQWEFAPGPQLDLLFFGFCFGKPAMSKGEWPEYLKKHQPIGARDPGTIERLNSHGVDATWTGCLTLRLGSFVPKVPAEERKGVYLVDLSDHALKTVPPDVREEAETLTNYLVEEELFDSVKRIAKTAKQLDKLRGASMVITSRLHIALPCVGFGVPVHLIVHGKESKRHRLSGFDGFIPTRYLDKDDENPELLDLDHLEPARIPEELDQAFDAFCEELTTRSGGLGTQQYTSLSRTDRITLPNPGLGSKPGKIGLDLGMRIVERTPVEWTEDSITFELESFSSFERARIPVLVGRPWVKIGPFRRMRWKQVGLISDFLKDQV